jgi:endonuclease YncB( thermonuclease family)
MSRRFRRRPPLWLGLMTCLIAAFLVRGWLTPQDDQRDIPPGLAKVQEVVDGKTLMALSASAPGPPQRIRLLGVALTDERAAAQWLNDAVAGQTIRIELDKRRRAGDGAQLAYVYLGPMFINAELIRRGWATHDAYPGDSASHARTLNEASKK